MSTRCSIFYHHNEETDLTIHIFEELAMGCKNDIRLDVEFSQGTINVPWPREAFRDEMLLESVINQADQKTQPV